MENEVNLVEYIKVVSKRKKLILICTVVFALVGILTWFYLPKPSPVFIVKNLISVQSIADPVQLTAEINSGFYGSYEGLSATAVNLILLEISIKTENLDEGERILRGISNSIVDKYNERIDKEKKNLENRIARLEKDMELLKSDNQQIVGIYLSIQSLKDRLDDLKLAKISSDSFVVEEEKKPAPSPFFNLVSGILLGFFVGIFLSFLIEWWEKNKGKLR